jgi:hypothetical protein
VAQIEGSDVIVDSSKERTSGSYEYYSKQTGKIIGHYVMIKSI